mgnify:CR=1 FL=1
MKQIKIGTCVPGAKAEEWLKGFIGKGFETFPLISICHWKGLTLISWH